MRIRSRPALRIASVLLAIAVLLPALADAHTKSASYSRFRMTDGGAQVRVRLPLLELTRFPPEHDWPSYLTQHLRLFAGDEICAPSNATRVEATAPGWAVFRWEATCPSEDSRRIESTILADVLSSHLHFARVSDPEAGVLERVLVPAAPTWSLAPGEEESVGTSFSGYVVVGIEHILAGWDHLAFVAALLILSTSFREVATLVTSFTIAHSITLALAVLGVVRPEAAAVEILIGFSIALVAAENGWLLGGKTRSIPYAVTGGLLIAAVLAIAGSGVLSALAWTGLAVFSACHFGLLQTSAGSGGLLRAIVAFAFGLVHGFGFAGILMEIELPTSRLVPALLGFNVGVELGQLAVVVLLWPALRALARLGDGRWYIRVAETGSAAILGLGLYWVVIRNWG
ncbi:MAG: HupE/UreJ family protein [Candidatus Binatia bacterium]|nr:HupE/UreJ family protein [Candidatus Binatia bacterium]